MTKGRSVTRTPYAQKSTEGILDRRAKRDFVFHKYSPWDFYEMYGGGELDVSLVLCNKRTEVRVIRVYNVVDMGFDLPQMRHRNIIDIYKTYCFKGQIFIASEYLDFSLEDLL
jgi:hypothetical protein